GFGVDRDLGHEALTKTASLKLHMVSPSRSRTLATTATSTRTAPAAFSALAQPSAVARVVITSSLSRIRRPATWAARPAGTWKAPATLRRRPPPDLPPWLAVARFRTRASGR